MYIGRKMECFVIQIGIILHNHQDDQVNYFARDAVVGVCPIKPLRLPLPFQNEKGTVRREDHKVSYHHHHYHHYHPFFSLLYSYA